jgi:hypothetical protein
MLSIRRQNQSKVQHQVEHLEKREVPAVLASFGAAGASFNDATRVAEGGLWQTAVQESNQPTGTVHRYVNDLTDVKDTLTAEKLAGSFTGTALSHVNLILNDLSTAITNAPASAGDAAAQTALHNAQLNILNTVAQDGTLTGRAAGGFQQVPQRLAAGVTAATAPKHNLAQIGAIFNDAANRSIGGLGSDANADAITADIQAVRTGIQTLRTNFPGLFGGLTGVHADVIVRQIPLEVQKGINEVGVTPVAQKESNDILLDIIDIIQGDTNLVNMANQNGIAGFGVFPDALTAPTRYQDSQDQTTFLANVIVKANTLGTQAVNLVTNHPEDTTAINNLITQLNNFETNTGNFLVAQGGLYEARFDNELIATTSTNGAAVAATIRGLREENIALVTAGATQLHENVADVSGNNIPVTGGAYNADGVTVADVLSTAH